MCTLWSINEGSGGEPRVDGCCRFEDLVPVCGGSLGNRRVIGGWGLIGVTLGPHASRLTAEAIAHRPLAAHQTAPQPCAMRDAIIITLDLDPNASAPHGVTPVQPFDRPLKRKPQTPHGILGVNRNGMAAVRMRVQCAHHGFHGGIVKRKHGAVSFGAAAMIVATPAPSHASVHPDVRSTGLVRHPNRPRYAA